jgi:hypothetical protein
MLSLLCRVYILKHTSKLRNKRFKRETLTLYLTHEINCECTVYSRVLVYILGFNCRSTFTFGAQSCPYSDTVARTGTYFSGGYVYEHYGMDNREIGAMFPEEPTYFFSQQRCDPASQKVGTRGRDVKVTIYLNTMPKLKRSVAVPPLPHTSSWRGA